VAARAEEPSVSGVSDKGKPDVGDDALPQLDFATFVLSLSHSVLMHLGEVPPVEGAEGETAQKDLPLARQTIDLLGLLEEKTKGNLTGDEERLLSHVLYDLRMRFVEVSKGKKV
jgi:Domain of unknown function (DUF1844)